MKFVSNWQDLPSLLLPDSVMSVLRKELILPFDDELSAMNFWGEVGVTLMYIEPGDVLEDIKRHVLNVIHHLIAKEGANKRGNSSRLTQSFHFFMFEPIFSPVNALNQPI